MNRPNILPRDLTDSRVVFERAPHEAALDKHVMVDGEWTTRLYILTRGLNGLSDRPAPSATQAAIITTLNHVNRKTP